MSRVLIFSGTTEGRKLSEVLSAAGIICDVCVATEYGREVMNHSDNINVICARLDVSDMKALYQKNEYVAVIDATHPYASIVTNNIKESLIDSEIKYLRLTRASSCYENTAEDNLFVYETTEECAKALADTTGSILLTTGSKDLNKFTKSNEIRDRLKVRIIPSLESLNICAENGIKGSSIIAMQGPFSKEMNLAMIRQYDIKHLVTKVSGKNGGEDFKIEAAKEAGIKCHIIKCPEENKDTDCYQICDVVKEIESITGIMISSSNIDVSLVGTGCGSELTLTRQARAAIDEADYIFGAKRMLSFAGENKIKYPYYTFENIEPVIGEIHDKNFGKVKIAILFSGDTGFFSGCASMIKSLESLEYVKVRVIPGISSIQYLSAKAGICWNDGKIISLHGDGTGERIKELISSVKYNEKTIFITSGVKDINDIGRALNRSEYSNDDIRILVGRNLSYDDESFIESVDELIDENKSGLYAGLIINHKAKKKIITPSLRDDDFIRDKVPMTKESVRRLSISKLELVEDAVVYDIGSGTGSIAIEAALLSPRIKVFAIECNEQAVSLIKQNIDKHDASNVEIVKKMAPDGLSELPKATHAFIGGSRGNLAEIIDTLYLINPYMRVVMTAVSLESISSMNEIIKEYCIKDLDIIQVGVSKINHVGNYSMMNADNPVFIFSFSFEKRENATNVLPKE